MSRIVSHFKRLSASVPTKAEQNPWHSSPSVIWKVQFNIWHSYDRLPEGILGSKCRYGYFLSKGTHWFFLSELVTETWKTKPISQEKSLRQGLQKWWAVTVVLGSGSLQEDIFHSPVREGDTGKSVYWKLPQGKIRARSSITCYTHRWTNKERPLWGTDATLTCVQDFWPPS